jgi:hypothetical protein
MGVVRRQWGVLLALGLLAVAALPASSATFYPILTNGPSSNRLDIAFLAEGYTSNQVSKFLTDCTNALAALMSHSPFTEYQGHFNAGAIAVASTQSGSDHPAYSLSRNTYFNSSYDATSDYVITIPTGSTGQGKVTTLLNTFMPGCDLSVLLVNDVTFGGSDGSGQTAIASAGAASAIIVPHETGHVLANLGDEYDTAFSYPDTEEPNTTRETRRDYVKWKAWIADTTPVPTPETLDYSATVGLFEGAHYHTTGWYRPKLDCMMNSMQTEFCEVCREALVLAFYQKTRPIEGTSPSQAVVSLTAPQDVTFDLQLLQPVAEPLNVTWVLNGAEVQSSTNQQYVVASASLKPGANTVVALVQDRTALVRTDASNLLTQSMSWTVNLNITSITLSEPILLPQGAVAFRVSGSAAGPVYVQASSSLVSWSTISTNNLNSGEFWVTNTPAMGSAGNFYRAATQP